MKLGISQSFFATVRRTRGPPLYPNVFNWVAIVPVVLLYRRLQMREILKNYCSLLRLITYFSCGDGTGPQNLIHHWKVIMLVIKYLSRNLYVISNTHRFNLFGHVMIFREKLRNNAHKLTTVIEVLAFTSKICSFSSSRQIHDNDIWLYDCFD